MIEVFPLPLHFDNAGMHGGRRCVVTTRRFKAITSLGIVEVEPGFTSDGGSIPRAAWSIIGSPFDEYLEECVVHDWLYSPRNKEFTRDEADFILKELMWNRDVHRWKVAAFYLAVRLAGWKFYNGKK